MAKQAIITGGASGIGLATAGLLLETGWAVALIDQNAEMLEKAQAALGADQESACTAHRLDVTDAGAIEAAFAAIAQHGPITALVNSAGIAQAVSFEETTPELFRAILDVNVIGSFLVAQRRYCAPREIAEAIAFLLSDKASYITGHVLAVDGGFCAGGVFRANDS